MYLGDFAEDETIYTMFNTFTSDDPSASCTITNFVNTDVHIHKDDGTTQRNNAAGITVSTNFDGITGSHMIKIDTNDNTVAGFWIKGHDYFVRIEGTTVDGATINSVVAHFSIENRLMRGTDSAALAATALTDVTWTDAKAAFLNASISTIDTVVDGIQTDLSNATDGLGALKTLIEACNTTTPPTTGEIKTALEAAGSHLALIMADTNELQTNQANWATATGFSTHNAADVKTALEAVGSHLALIMADTDDLQTNQGAWATATGFSTHSAANVWAVASRVLTANTNFNDLTDAEVKAEVVEALADIKLDHLLNIAVDTNWATTVHLDSVIGHIADVGTAATYDRTTDALEVIRNRGDAAWVTATGFNTITPPTVIQIREEMDTNSTKMAPSQILADYKATGFSVPNEYDSKFEDIKVLLNSTGNIFYVSKSGDNSDGTTLAKAKTTIDGAIGLCTANNGDRIYIAPGTYDETANGASGILCDVEGIWIHGILPGVNVKNTNTLDNGKVFYVTANNTLISNVAATKGETTSNNSIVIDVNGTITADTRDTTISTEKTNHIGIKFRGGAVACSYMDGDNHLSHIYSNSGNGIGVEFADCIGCVVIDPQIHDLTFGMKFTGGASCHHNTVSTDTMILSCDTGIQLDVGALSNMLSAILLNCTTDYADNSGNDTNKTEGSLSYVLEDILAAIVAALPQIHYATSSSTVTYGSVASGTYSDTDTDNDVYWQVNPDAVNALDMYSQFLIGAGRVPSVVEFNGRFQSHVARYCEVCAWNYSTSTWDTISSDSNRIGHATSDFDRQFSLTPEHYQSSDGQMKIRIHSTSTTIGDDLYIDKMVVTSVAAAAGGLTADAVASSTWNRDVETFTGAKTAGSRLRRIVAMGTEVSISDSTTSFTVADGITSNSAYKGMDVRVGCAAAGDCETRRIISWTSGRVMTLDRPLSSVPQVGDLVRILNQYSNVNTDSIEESDPSDVINAACDTANADYGANTVVPDAAGVAPTVVEIRQEMDTNSTKMAPSQVLADYRATGFSVPNEYDAELTAIQADLDNPDQYKATSVTVSDKTGFSLSSAGVDAILDVVIEGTHTLRQYMRTFASVLLAKVTGGGTDTITYRDVDDSKDRVVTTVTGDGDRTAVVLDES